MADTTVNSTRVVQGIATFGGVQTTMDTCSLVIYTPNLVPAIGPIGVTPISTGVYQYAIPPGTLTLPGTWTHVWYVQKGTQSLQSTGFFTVGA